MSTSSFLLPTCVSFEPYFIVSVSANILGWHSFSFAIFVLVCVVVLGRIVIVFVLF